MDCPPVDQAAASSPIPLKVYVHRRIDPFVLQVVYHVETDNRVLIDYKESAEKYSRRRYSLDLVISIVSAIAMIVFVLWVKFGIDRKNNERK